MDVKTAEIIARLRKYTSIEGLEEADKRRFFEMLKLIGKSGAQGDFISGLRGKKGLGGRYLRAAAIWMKEKGWIKSNSEGRHNQIFLTENGNNALSVLERDCYSPLADPKLKVHFLLDDEEKIISTSIEGKGIQPVEKLTVLSRGLVREGIMKIAHSLIEHNRKDIVIKIEIPPLHASRLTFFIDFIEEVYWFVLFKSGCKGLRTHELIIEIPENEKIYTSFWKNYLEKHLSLKINEVHRSKIWISDWNGQREESYEQPLFDFFVKELGYSENMFYFFLDYLSEPPIRKWIEEKLAKDPDWFMPSYFWKNPGSYGGYFLGFNLPNITLSKLESLVKDLGTFEIGEIPNHGTVLINTKRADQSVLDKVAAVIREKNGVCVQLQDKGFRVEFVERVKPPIWYTCSLQDITNEYFQLEFDLRVMADVGDLYLDPHINYLVKRDLNSELFYRNWRVLYPVFSEQNKEKIAQSKKLRELLELIQKANVKYILEGKPKIDLIAVLNNYKVTLDSSKLLQDIDNGKYDIDIV
jgi:hypothetical protein